MTDDWIKKIGEAKQAKRTDEESRREADIPSQGNFSDISSRFWKDLDDELRRVVATYNATAAPEEQLVLSEVSPDAQVFGVSSSSGSTLNVEFHSDELKIATTLAGREGRESERKTTNYGVQFDGFALHAQDHTVESLTRAILTSFLEAT
jgi:hypothetical protein